MLRWCPRRRHEVRRLQVATMTAAFARVRSAWRQRRAKSIPSVTDTVAKLPTLLQQPLISTASATVAAELEAAQLSPETAAGVVAATLHSLEAFGGLSQLSSDTLARHESLRAVARQTLKPGQTLLEESGPSLANPLEVKAAASAVLRRACFENMADRMVSYARPLPRSPPRPTRRARCQSRGRRGTTPTVRSSTHGC